MAHRYYRPELDVLRFFAFLLIVTPLMSNVLADENVTAACVALILATLGLPTVWALTYLGRISYGLYVFHFMFVMLLDVAEPHPPHRRGHRHHHDYSAADSCRVENARGPGHDGPAGAGARRAGHPVCGRQHGARDLPHHRPALRINLERG